MLSIGHAPRDLSQSDTHLHKDIRPMGIPSGPDAITAGWLTSVLREGGAIDRANVVSVSAGPIADARGLTSQMNRLSVNYDLKEADAPRSIIAKFSSPTPEMRNRPDTIFAYEREVRFYQQIAHKTTLPTPTFYYGDIDTETGIHVLLLGDLAPAVSGSRVAGCSPEQAEMAVRHIARFHAEWWESPQLERVSWLSDARDPCHDPDAARAEYEQWWPLFSEKTRNLLPDPIREIGERFGLHRSEIENHLFNTSPRTLSHGDYHLGNLVFGTPEEGGPFAVVDWQ
ncbi:MAG: phosphotransferase, partial [Chloroflexi bacterium]|nr:phosphotransferase [Chloroflexota bacterium]